MTELDDVEDLYLYHRLGGLEAAAASRARRIWFSTTSQKQR